MAIVNIDPEAGKFPYLNNGGKYGPGMENEADVKVSKFVAQVEADSKDAPAYDRSLDKADYCMFVFQVTQPDQVVYVRHWEPTGKNTGSKGKTYLAALGVPIDDAGNYDDDQVEGAKCILEVGPPNKGKGSNADKMYSGYVKDVIGLG